MNKTGSQFILELLIHIFFKHKKMNTNKLEVTKESALAAHKIANKEVQSVLETLFGKENFISGKITDRVKTCEDAANIVGISENLKILLAYDGVDKTMLGAQAMAKLTIIAKALNEGWEPNWEDSNEPKYVPYFDNYKSGFGFSCSYYGSWRAHAGCGSRLCFKTRELAEYAAKQFITEYNQFLTL